MKITEIEGIGPANAQKLRGQGVFTTEKLLQAGSTRSERRHLALATGITEALILGWVNRADLMRISGVGQEYSDLLEKSGVDTVKELRRRNPENLYAAMKEVNRSTNLVRRMPSQAQVQRWIKEAGELAPMISY